MPVTETEQATVQQAAQIALETKYREVLTLRDIRRSDRRKFWGASAAVTAPVLAAAGGFTTLGWVPAAIAEGVVLTATGLVSALNAQVNYRNNLRDINVTPQEARAIVRKGRAQARGIVKK